MRSRPVRGRRLAAPLRREFASGLRCLRAHPASPCGRKEAPCASPGGAFGHVGTCEHTRTRGRAHGGEPLASALRPSLRRFAACGPCAVDGPGFESRVADVPPRSEGQAGRPWTELPRFRRFCASWSSPAERCMKSAWSQPTISYHLQFKIKNRGDFVHPRSPIRSRGAAGGTVDACGPCAVRGPALLQTAWRAVGATGTPVRFAILAAWTNDANTIIRTASRSPTPSPTATRAASNAWKMRAKPWPGMTRLPPRASSARGAAAPRSTAPCAPSTPRRGRARRPTSSNASSANWTACRRCRACTCGRTSPARSSMWARRNSCVPACAST